MDHRRRHEKSQISVLNLTAYKLNLFSLACEDLF